jgi:hypothetical protein
MSCHTPTVLLWGTVEKVGLTAGMWSAADPFVRALDRA